MLQRYSESDEVRCGYRVREGIVMVKRKKEKTKAKPWLFLLIKMWVECESP